MKRLFTQALGAMIFLGILTGAVYLADIADQKAEDFKVVIK